MIGAGICFLASNSRAVAQRLDRARFQMPDQKTSVIPQLEALEKVFALCKQHMCLCRRFFFGETEKFFDGPNMTVTHEIASHECNSLFNEEFAVP
jgi:hypothetical protein